MLRVTLPANLDCGTARARLTGECIRFMDHPGDKARLGRRRSGSCAKKKEFRELPLMATQRFLPGTATVFWGQGWHPPSLWHEPVIPYSGSTGINLAGERSLLLHLPMGREHGMHLGPGSKSTAPTSRVLQFVRCGEVND